MSNIDPKTLKEIQEEVAITIARDQSRSGGETSARGLRASLLDHESTVRIGDTEVSTRHAALCVVLTFFLFVMFVVL